MSSDPYEKVKGGRLVFKGGALATRKSIDKKKKKKLKNKNDDDAGEESQPVVLDSESGSGEAYTIDAAKRMKYEQLFPVEAKKFGYDPKNPGAKSVEDALEDRVKKKADRYCK